MVGGKAELAREDYCDGLGDCLPACPTGAISFVTRETKPFDEKAVAGNAVPMAVGKGPVKQRTGADGRPVQWPIQLKLVPLKAPFFNGADLVVAADCTAFASPDVYKGLRKDKALIVMCPKLDSGDNSERLAQILSNNEIRSVTVIRMEVPCCGALERIAKDALTKSQKNVPFKTIIIATDGTVL